MFHQQRKSQSFGLWANTCSPLVTSFQLPRCRGLHGLEGKLDIHPELPWERSPEEWSTDMRQQNFLSEIKFPWEATSSTTIALL
eukprot:1141482-Pelagomonas_calceolata.AAC.2